MKDRVFYIYRHVRLDTNEVFYIGIGKMNYRSRKFTSVYKRAFRKGGRSKYWKNITNKTKYDVEIIFHSSTQEEIFEKEKEFIKLYGRKDLKLGTLANFCDGGRGPNNTSFSAERKLQCKLSLESRGLVGENHPCASPVYCYHIDGTFYKFFETQKAASIDLKIDQSLIGKSSSGKIHQCGGMVFKKTYMGEKINIVLPRNQWHKPVECFDKNRNFIKSFDLLSDAAKFVNSSTTSISRACKLRVLHKGYYFFYKEI